MRNPYVITCILVLGCFAELSAEKKPNVVIIYTDDQGSIDAHCYGATDLHTPNMDRLAETGVRFTQFYAAAAICSPSRAALLTGLTPLGAGLPGNSPKGKGGLPAEQVTIAEVLKSHGYSTAHIGKWHLGETEETLPMNQGFDYSFGHMGGCIDNYSHFFYWAGPNRHDMWENGREIWMDGEYFPDLMSTKALRYIDDHKDVAFFVYYAINLPHYPYQGTKKWRDHYRDLDEPRNHYAACVSTVDERIGILLEKLEENGLRENTIIVFQSDHGHSMETRAFGGGGNSGIYRGAKFSFFEGGIRVPAIISYPAELPQDVVRDQMAVNTDWLPTILDLCGIHYSTDNFEGLSLEKVIMGNEASPHEVFCWHQEKDYWAIRKGDWKLLRNPRDPSAKGELTEEDAYFLANIREQPDEMKNLATRHPEKVEELTKEYENWYKSLLKE